MIVFPTPKVARPQYRRPTRPVKNKRPAPVVAKTGTTPQGIDVVKEVHRIITGSATPACDLLVLVDDGYLTATEATQALQGTGRNIADVHSAAAFEIDQMRALGA